MFCRVVDSGRQSRQSKGRESKSVLSRRGAVNGGRAVVREI